uniref:Uncharacterized protein n=1 Tax=Panagrolaimus sp. ES5 TaxID=591445 RepID=A0AC34G314_9BILA
MPSYYLSINGKIHDKEKSKKEKNSNAVNNSTLSLHIAFYENLNEATNELSEEEERLVVKNKKFNSIRKYENVKQLFTGSAASLLQNPFEFLRQQQNQSYDPEIMQFKASQSLFNPNTSQGIKMS